MFFGRLTNSWCRMRTPRTCMQAYSTACGCPDARSARSPCLARAGVNAPGNTPALWAKSAQKRWPQAVSTLRKVGAGPAETMAGISSAAQKPQRQMPTNTSAARLHGHEPMVLHTQFRKQQAGSRKAWAPPSRPFGLGIRLDVTNDAREQWLESFKIQDAPC